MDQLGPAPNYKPVYYMPVIGPSETTPVTVVPVSTDPSSSNLGLKIKPSKHTDIFAKNGGYVRFYPAGRPLPTAGAEPATGAGSLVLKTWIQDFNELNSGKLPIGVPAQSQVIYENVDPPTVIAALKPVVEKLPLTFLKNAPQAPKTEDKTILVVHLLDRLIQGDDIQVFVPGGTPLGKAKLSNASDPASGEFILRMSDESRHDLSPILYLTLMPTYAEPRWQSHPLVFAASFLPVPTNIYLKFEVWNDNTRSFELLPSGIDVNLMNELLSGDQTLATLPINSKGSVRFSLPDITALTDNRLHANVYFLIDLNDAISKGKFNTVLPDPIWSTKELYTTNGLFLRFRGTQLGHHDRPLVYRNGLGFWADLISFRPPLGVQTGLKDRDMFTQRIEREGRIDGDSTGDINLDYYPVRIMRLPSITGQATTTAESLLEFIRRDIAKGLGTQFLDTTIDDFEGYDPPDTAKWLSDDPLGSVLHINMKFGANVDDGAVVCGLYTPSKWRFSTVHTNGDLYHPVSGIREFGFFDDGNGVYTFYTRGADRVARILDSFVSGQLVFPLQDLNWRRLQELIFKFVMKNNGLAEIGPAFANRFTWEKIKEHYHSPNIPWID